MRRCVGIAILAAALGACPSATAAQRFPTGWWESTEIDSADGQATSFELRRSKRGRYQVRHLLTWGNDCGWGDIGSRDPRIPVDRRGRFRYRIRWQSDGITAVRGRLTDWRRHGATLRLYWDSLSVSPNQWCRLTHSFAMHPVTRVPVREGRWTGTDGSGRPVEFFVREQGRYIYGLRAPGPYPIRCTDGSVDSLPAAVLAAWIAADGTVSLPASPDSESPDIALDARLTGTSATGSFRLVAPPGEPPYRHVSSCDSDTIPFQAAWAAPR
jgi:hypothetical protein